MATPSYFARIAGVAMTESARSVVVPPRSPFRPAPANPGVEEFPIARDAAARFAQANAHEDRAAAAPARAANVSAPTRGAAALAALEAAAQRHAAFSAADRTAHERPHAQSPQTPHPPAPAPRTVLEHTASNATTNKPGFADVKLPNRRRPVTGADRDVRANDTRLHSERVVRDPTQDRGAKPIGAATERRAAPNGAAAGARSGTARTGVAPIARSDNSAQNADARRTVSVPEHRSAPPLAPPPLRRTPAAYPALTPPGRGDIHIGTLEVRIVSPDAPPPAPSAPVPVRPAAPRAPRPDGRLARAFVAYGLSQG